MHFFYNQQIAWCFAMAVIKAGTVYTVQELFVYLGTKYLSWEY